MKILFFVLGLSAGLLLLWWQHTRFNRKIQRLLRNFPADGGGNSLPTSSQLSMAIVQHQQIRQQLEQRLEAYDQILQVAPLGYLQVDEESRLVWCNTKARELLGIVQDYSLKPRLLLEYVRSYELDSLIEQTRNSGTPAQSEWVFHPVSLDPENLSQPKPYALRAHGFPLPQQHVGIFLENYQEVVLLRQQRDRWASDVAHELKTPLTSIRLVAETLQSRLEPPLRNWVDRLVRETIRMGNLVQDLLDLSQLERGSSHSLQLKTVDLVELIHTAWLNLEPLARKKHLQLDYSGPSRLLVKIDEPRMYRVLVNLLDNSIKYSPVDESITVHLNSDSLNSETPGAPRQQVHLDIIDTGPGFPESALPFVFERFYRADPSRARSASAKILHGTPPGDEFVSNKANQPKNHGYDRLESPSYGGSGLGLAIVQQIVEAHQGTVRASNHPESGGAWLSVCFPQT